MSTGKTTYLGLHRWEPDDDFLRTEFNENSDKLDSELQAMQKEMDGEFSAIRAELAAEISGVESALSGKAASSHSHTPASIGAAASSHSHTAAAIGAAAASHNHAAGDITSGTLPVARGGTGVTSIANLLTALYGAGAVRMQSGSYTGTGSYGSGSPNRLTFNFPPKFVCVTKAGYSSSAETNSFIWTTGGSQIFAQTFDYRLTCTSSGNTLSWYVNAGGAGNHQCNTSGAVYYYIAIG